MWQIESNYQSSNFYQTLEKELISLVESENNLIANLSNISSWIYHSIPNLNWCGFYLWNEMENQLILGPFQGKPACNRIAPNKGVCGKSFSQNQPIRVGNVYEFPGHIACDSSSLSELVVPLTFNHYQFGVLDLDSPLENRFSVRDESELTKVMSKLTPIIFKQHL